MSTSNGIFENKEAVMAFYGVTYKDGEFDYAACIDVAAFNIAFTAACMTEAAIVRAAVMAKTEKDREHMAIKVADDIATVCWGDNTGTVTVRLTDDGDLDGDLDWYAITDDDGSEFKAWLEDADIGEAFHWLAPRA